MLLPLKMSGAGAGGAAEEFDAVSVASILESDGAAVVVDLASACMAIVESDCTGGRTRIFILKVGAACNAIIEDDCSPKIRIVRILVVTGGCSHC